MPDPSGSLYIKGKSRAVAHDDVPESPTSTVHDPTSPPSVHFKDYKSKGFESDSDKSPTSEQRAFDPEEYNHAKKKLKKAVLEHYR